MTTIARLFVRTGGINFVELVETEENLVRSLANVHAPYWAIVRERNESYIVEFYSKSGKHATARRMNLERASETAAEWAFAV